MKPSQRDLRNEPIDLRARAEAMAIDLTNIAEKQESDAAVLEHLSEDGKAVAEQVLEGANYLRAIAALLDLLAAEIA